MSMYAREMNHLERRALVLVLSCYGDDERRDYECDPRKGHIHLELEILRKYAMGESE